MMRFLVVSVLAVACGSDEEKTELFRIQQPSVPDLGELAVEPGGKYILWYPGDATKPERRGDLSTTELMNVRRATDLDERNRLMACASADFDRCSGEQQGYVMTTQSGTGCWVATEVQQSCAAAQHFMVLRDLLHAVSERESQ